MANSCIADSKIVRCIGSIIRVHCRSCWNSIKIKLRDVRRCRRSVVVFREESSAALSLLRGRKRKCYSYLIDWRYSDPGSMKVTTTCYSSRRWWSFAYQIHIWAFKVVDILAGERKGKQECEACQTDIQCKLRLSSSHIQSSREQWHVTFVQHNGLERDLYSLRFSFVCL